MPFRDNQTGRRAASGGDWAPGGLAACLALVATCGLASPPPARGAPPQGSPGPAPTSAEGSGGEGAAAGAGRTIPGQVGLGGGPERVWCRHGGAPAVGDPLLDETGRLYSLTSDGYLHAFEADGRYRFSYTVSGTPLGSPSLRPGDGAILLGTTRRFIYAITQAGSLYFRGHTVSPVWSGLYPLDRQSVVYVGLDRHLYALSNQGGPLYRVAIPGHPVGEPAIGPDGLVWLPLDSGVARFERAYRVDRTPTPSPVERVVPLGRGAVALVAEEAWYLDQRGRPSSLGPAAWLAGGDDEVLLLAPNGAAQLVLRGGEVVPLELAWGELSPQELSAEPGLSRDHLALPLGDGRLVVLPRRARRFGPGRSLAIADVALTRPTIVGSVAALGTSSGQVCVVSLE